MKTSYTLADNGNILVHRVVNASASGYQVVEPGSPVWDQAQQDLYKDFKRFQSAHRRKRGRHLTGLEDER